MKTIETLKHTLEHAQTLEELKAVQELIKKNKIDLRKKVDTIQPSDEMVRFYELSGGRPEFIQKNWASFPPEVKEEFNETVAYVEELEAIWEDVLKLEETVLEALSSFGTDA